LAILLSLVVILAWSGLVAKLHPPVAQEVIAKQPPPIFTTVKTPLLESKALAEDTVWEKISLENREIIFGLPSASIKEIIFKDYQNHKFSLVKGLWLKDSTLNFKVKQLGTAPTFIYEDKEKRILKEFYLHNSNYSIGLDIKIQNLSPGPLNIDYPLILSYVDLNKGQLESSFQQVVLQSKEKLSRLNLRSDFDSSADLQFLAVKDRYFTAIIEPTVTGFHGFIRKISQKETEIGLGYNSVILPGQELKLNFLIYIGPQQLQTLAAIKKDWIQVIYYGTFDPISRFLLKLLEFFQRVVRNWGVAIILLSLLVYFTLFPLTLKQMRSMKHMQELQPKIENLKQQYKDNPQRLNKEIMELYKKEKVNPFSGCIPLLLQIPIFFALYQALIRSIALKGAHFLWIKDLSEPDRLILFSRSLPLIGSELNILPILMAGLMFLQQKFSAVSAAGTSQEQQKLMMILFPILFGFIFYHMSSGLVLYWFVNTLLMFVYQAKIKLQT